MAEEREKYGTGGGGYRTRTNSKGRQQGPQGPYKAGGASGYNKFNVNNNAGNNTGSNLNNTNSANHIASEQVQINEAIASLSQELEANKMKIIERKDREKFLKKLCFKWHPDKCQEEAGKFIATCVFQWLQNEKENFLA